MPGSLTEKIYYRMPVFVQNGIFSLAGWSLRRKRYNRCFYDQLARLKEMEWWSKGQIEEYQNSKVVETVRHAYQTVPFYRRWYDEHGVNIDAITSTSDLPKLPVLTKSLVREHQEAMVSTRVNRKWLIKGLTSGTTGTPLTVYLTADGLAFQWAVWWRHKARFGLTPGDRHLTFGARVPIDQTQSRPPYWRKDYFNHRVYLSTYHISKRTLRDIVAYLNGEHFVFYTGYPSAMFALTSLMEDAGLELTSPPRCVVTGSDALLPKYEAAVRRVFRAPVTEQYGMGEFAGNMAKCPEGLFHVDFECGLVETLPTEAFDRRRLILTGWGNPAMPFIRYEIGDYGRPSAGDCPCGRQSDGFASIDGRLEDFVIMPDGRKLIGMNQVFEYAKNAKEIQLYQPSANAVEFRVVPAEGFGKSDKDSLLREFQRRAGGEMEVTFRLVDALERSASGKLKAVISEVEPRGQPY